MQLFVGVGIVLLSIFMTCSECASESVGNPTTTVSESVGNATTTVSESVNNATTTLSEGSEERAIWLSRPKQEALKCGYVSTCAEGHILLKPFKGLEKNTRCIWVVSVPEATQYEVVVHHAGFMEKQLTTAGLAVTPLVFENTSPETLQFKSMEEPLSVSAHALLITFYTTNEYIDGGSGFILQYKATAMGKRSGLIPISTNSEYHQLNYIQQHYRHPARTNFLADPYEGRELSIITISPRDNKCVPGTNTHVLYKKLTPTESTGCKYAKLVYFNFVLENGRVEYEGDEVLCESANLKSMRVDDLAFFMLIGKRRSRDPKRAFELTMDFENILSGN